MGRRLAFMTHYSGTWRGKKVTEHEKIKPVSSPPLHSPTHHQSPEKWAKRAKGTEGNEGKRGETGGGGDDEKRGEMGLNGGMQYRKQRTNKMMGKLGQMGENSQFPFIFPRLISPFSP